MPIQPHLSRADKETGLFSAAHEMWFQVHVSLAELNQCPAGLRGGPCPHTAIVRGEKKAVSPAHHKNCVTRKLRQGNEPQHNEEYEEVLLLKWGKRNTTCSTCTGFWGFGYSTSFYSKKINKIKITLRISQLECLDDPDFVGSDLGAMVRSQPGIYFLLIGLIRVLTGACQGQSVSHDLFDLVPVGLHSHHEHNCCYLLSPSRLTLWSDGP